MSSDAGKSSGLIPENPENLQRYPQAFQYCRRHPLNHLQNSCQFLSDEVLFLCTVFQLLYNAIGNLTSIQCLIFYEAGDDGNGYSSQEMILFLEEKKESSNYYILKNIECQKKSNQNKGAAILNE